MTRYAQIISTGRYIPEKVVTNADLDEMLGENVGDWLVENVGIHERHVMADDETTSDMVVAATRQALARADIAAADLDLRENRYAPAAIVLMVLGMVIMAWQGDLPDTWALTISLPPLTVPRLGDVWQAMLLAGFAQIPLSITNAVMAPATLIRDYFPEKEVSERKLILNVGFMNTAASFLGGMPMCHGAGGLAGQYYFGARTGGTPIMEGLIEVAIGLFLSRSIADLMAAFPMPLIAGMMLLVGIELARPVIKLRGWKLGLAVGTAALSVATNMAIGFAGGLAVTHLLRELKRRSVLPCICNSEEESQSDV